MEFGLFQQSREGRPMLDIIEPVRMVTGVPPKAWRLMPAACQPLSISITREAGCLAPMSRVRVLLTHLHESVQDQFLLRSHDVVSATADVVLPLALFEEEERPSSRPMSVGVWVEGAERSSLVR